MELSPGGTFSFVAAAAAPAAQAVELGVRPKLTIAIDLTLGVRSLPRP